MSKDIYDDDREVTNEILGSEDVKPCPFCGKNVVLLIKCRDDRYNITCNNNKCVVFALHSGFTNRRDAIFAWNRRANDE